MGSTSVFGECECLAGASLSEISTIAGAKRGRRCNGHSITRSPVYLSGPIFGAGWSQPAGRQAFG